MAYQIGKLKVSVTYNGNSYRLTGLDTIDLSSNAKNTRVFPKDGSVSGITQSTGRNEADVVTFTATYLPKTTQDILFTIHEDTSSYCTLIITNEESNIQGGKNRIVLDYAIVESNLFQTNIDDTAGSKYKITFNGKFKKTETSIDR